MALMLAEALRRTLRDAWTLVRPYRLAAVAGGVAVGVVAAVIVGGTSSGALLVSALVAIAAVNAAWWWVRDREQRTRIDNLTAKVAALIVTRSRTAGERDAAQRAFEAAEAEIERLTRSEVTATLHERMEGQS